MKDFIFKPGKTTIVAYTGTASGPTAISAGVNVVRIRTTTAARLNLSGVAATAADMWMGINLPEYFVISPGGSVSAIQDSAGGNVEITEMTP